MEQPARIGRRRKECGVCADGSCKKCKARAYHREYNLRQRGVGRRSPLSPEEERIRDLLRKLTGQDTPAPPKPAGHQCFDLDCQHCQAAEELRERNRAQRAAAAGCRCGLVDCDCATWDKIYREKFEDTTYYSRDRGIPKHSPFADL